MIDNKMIISLLETQSLYIKVEMVGIALTKSCNYLLKTT